MKLFPIASGNLQAPNRFIANTATVLVAQVGRAAISLLLEVVYARFLGPAGRGQMSLCMMVIGIGVLVGGLGGEIPIMIWAADQKRKASEWLPSVFLCGLVGSAIACSAWATIFWVWHPAFLAGITNTLAVILLCSLPFSVFETYCFALLLGLERFQQRSLVIVVSQAIVLGTAFTFFLFLKASATTAMIAVVLGLSAGITIAVWGLRDRLKFDAVKSRNFSEIGAALSLGVRGQLGNVATFFNYRLDIFIVNYFLNTTEVGIYALGVIISEALWQVPNAAAVAILPRTARTIDESDPRFMCLVCRQVFILACASGLAIAVLSPWIVPLVFGAKFAPSVAVIWWILPGTIMLASAKVMSADLLARGMPEYSAMFAGVTLIVTVILDLWLIPRMGIQGAALASSLAYLVNTILVAGILKSKLGVSWKALYLPSVAELTPYWQVWSRLMSRLRPSAAA